ESGERLTQLVRETGGELPHRCDTEHARELVLVAACLLLRAKALCDVPYGAYEVPIGSLVVGSHGQLRGKGRPILPPADDLSGGRGNDTARDVGPEKMCDPAVARVAVPGRHEGSEGQPDRLTRRVPEDTLGSLVERQDAPVRVERDDAVHG